MNKPRRISSQDDTIRKAPKSRSRKPPPTKKRQHRLMQPSNDSLPVQSSQRLERPPKRSVSVPTSKRQQNRRSSSENDVLPPAGNTGHKLAVMMEEEDIVDNIEDSLDPCLTEEINNIFNNEMSSLLLSILCNLKLLNKSSIAVVPNHVVLLSAASKGFKPANLGRLKTWLEEISEIHSDQNPKNNNSSRHSSRVIPPQRHTHTGGSLDSVLAREGGTRSKEGVLDHETNGSSSKSSSQSKHSNKTLAKHVTKRFRSEFVQEIVGILEDCMVEHEDDLAYVGETVLDNAMASGRLTMIQINKLSDWIDNVKQKRKGKKDRKSKASRVDDRALNTRLTEAISTAVTSPNASDRERAKSSASLAMFEISEKKRHFKGLRSDEDEFFIGTRF